MAGGGRRSTIGFGVKRSSRKPSLTANRPLSEATINTKTRRNTQPRRPSVEKRSKVLERRRTHAVALAEKGTVSAVSVHVNAATTGEPMPADNVGQGIVPLEAPVTASANVLATTTAVKDENRTTLPPETHNQPLRNEISGDCFMNNVGAALPPSCAARPRVESSGLPACQVTNAAPRLQEGREGFGEEYASDSFESDGDMSETGRRHI